MSEPNNIPLPEHPSPPVWGRRVFSFLLCLMILGAGVMGALYVGKGTPRARKRVPAKMAPLVSVQAVRPGSYRLAVNAMGSVIPAREMTVKSRVAGEIVSIHPEFTPGGFIGKGEELLRIDPADYQLAVSRKQSAVTEAEYAFKVEMGHQDVARREWRLLNGGGMSADGQDVELALRKPHLAKAEADLTAARADLEQAQLNLERTRVRVPFNAVVRTKNIEIGSQVASQGALGELVGTDAYYVRASVPTDRLRWIDIPQRVGRAGAKVRIFHQNGIARSGTVFKLLGDLETQGRMARLLILVTDPLGLDMPDGSLPPLLIGEFVRVEIEAREMDNVFQIPRFALRDNRIIWVAGNDDRLEIREVATVWRDSRTVVLTDGLAAGDRLIVSDLPAPIAGMPVRVATADSEMPVSPPPPKPRTEKPAP